MAYSSDDFYEGMAEQTAERLKRVQPYVDLALKQGDAIYQEKPWELTIRIRLPKKGTTDDTGTKSSR